MNSNLSYECPDDQHLLDYLAGELRPEAALDVARHLEICTDCALRADQLCGDIADIERAVEIELPLPPLRLAAARARLLKEQEAHESGRIAKAPGFYLGARRSKLALSFAVAILVAGVGVALHSLRDEPGLTATEALAWAHESMPAYSVQPTMTRFQVELTQLTPEILTRRYQLEIWTDPNSGAYASRLEDPDGSLRHAVWQSASSEPAFAFDRASGQRLNRIDTPGRRSHPSLLASMGDGIECEVLAAGFARWLERRQWHPLRVSRDFALLAASDATLRLERSGDAILVVARRQEEDLSAEVILTLDAESYEARSLVVQFWTPEGEAALKLVRNEVRFITASDFDTSVFEARIPVPNTSRVSSSPAKRSEPNPQASASRDLWTVEASVRHALHEAGACLGEPVEVERIEDRALAVRGVVGTNEMKAAILAALQRAETPDWVVLDIRTRAGAIAADALGIEVEWPATRTSVETAGPRDGAALGLPLAADLTAYFRADDPQRSSDLVGKGLTDFAYEAVERSDDLLQRAWALKKLAERYGAAREEVIPPKVQPLVEAMVRDHLVGIATAGRARADLVLPVLNAIAASRGVDAGIQGEISHRQVLADAWPDLALSLFETTSSIHKNTLALLTVRLPVIDGSANGAGPADSEDVDIDRTLARLLAATRSFEAEVTRTERAFAGRASLPTAAPSERGEQH